MADKVTMTALDTIHVSNVRSENLVEGDVFQVIEADAKRLEDAGLAERGGTASKALNADSVTSDRPDTREEIDKDRGFEEGKAISAAPANKALSTPQNKTASAAKSAKKGK